MPWLTLSVCILFLLCCWLLIKLQAAECKLSRLVLIGLVLGVAIGAGMQYFFGADDPQVVLALSWLKIVGGGYISLLKLVMMPLIAISILSAINKLENARSLGRISAVVIAAMLVLVMIAGFVGVLTTSLGGLTAQGLLSHGVLNSAELQSNAAEVQNLSLPQLLLSLIPTNVFADLAGSRSLSVIGVVIFSVLAGVALLQLRHDKPEAGALIGKGIDAVQLWVMKMVRTVIALTPYGVMALMINVVAHYRLQDILSLLSFIGLCYAAMLLMFVVHMLILLLLGKNPLHYLQNVWSVLTFAFISRSSAASIPLSIEAQKRMGIPDSIANFAASFGANMGQNGCAGIYPAMMVAMIAPTLGINPLDPAFLATLLPAIALGSIGVAGVGGGGTFAALIVLSALNFPIALVGVLMAIEPLVDMGRTALNVNGSIMAATIANRVLNIEPSTPQQAESLSQ
ncbi:cation:dicarboxylase symporter family transporter [Plesiomonas shigelloides]|uniref:L-cystine transporter n=1 Tax=Plesiomonas shigelloides TaxID=703 RepID=UPI0012626502|nr:cation:dicarboxylase symporter family transporter [Plesiomonas shigelloides]KAB7689644.1 cation:dicarboxylase symporter family transporter [Plesiomonas shigelloides]